jgi:hypothetical protein
VKVVRPVVKPVFVARWMLMPVAFVALFVHASETFVEPVTAVAVRAEGAAAVRVAVAVLLHAEAPHVLVACTL